jgi:uncharacterized membrane protein
MIIAALALVGVFVALYLTLFKIGVIGELSCTIGSCEQVNTSKWATFLGLPVAAWGIVFYVATLAVALTASKPVYEGNLNLSRALAGMSGLGFVFTLWLSYLELFVIHAICIWCVGSAVIVTAIFLLSLADLRSTPA